jgi:putative sigma-54 modulation protein
MKVTVQSIRFNADVKLLHFIQRKAEKLEQYFDQIVGAEVYLKLEHVEDESNKITEIKLMVPGGTLFARARCRSFEEATDLSIESLVKQIRKHKTRVRTKLTDQRSILILDEVVDY